MKSEYFYAFGSLFAIFRIIRHLDASVVEEFPCFQEQLNTGSLRNVVYDETGNVFYVGAVDSIYKLSPDLKTLNSRQTGPVCSTGVAESCKSCSDAHNVCPQNEEPVSSFNQLLLIDSTTRLLITCSNVYNGSCRSFSLDNLTPTLLQNISVLPANASLSAVGFIDRGQNATVLYVGASYSPDSENLYNVSMISVRNPNSFELLASVIDLNRDVQDTFSIEFVTAFQHAKYVYFFVRRRVSGTLATYLLRICKDEPKKTLVELPLVCSSNRGSNLSYLRDAILASYTSNGVATVAVYAIFTRDSSSGTVENSTLCIYPIGDINRAFQNAIQKCFDGTGVTGPRYATNNIHVCVNIYLVVESEYCGSIEINSPIEGNVTIQPQKTFPLPISVATSVTSFVVNGVFVLLIGSSNGQLLKATFDSPRNELSFDWIATPDKVSQPIKAIIVGAADNVYLLTNKYLCRVPAYNCSKAHSCDQCAKDPHCGWCMKSKSCTHKDRCPSVDKMDVWLNQLQQCPNVTVAEPLISVNQFRLSPILVNVTHIPEAPSASCTLKGKSGYVSDSFPASVSPTDDGNRLISCYPQFPSPQMSGSNSISLTLVVAFGDLQWFTADVMIFNCSQMNSCTECVKSVFPCTWCSVNHVCRHLSQLNECSVAEEKDTVNQSSMCTRIEAVTNATGSPLVSGSGQKANVNFSVINIASFNRTGDLKCRFGSGDSNFTYAKAILHSQTNDGLQSKHTVQCSPVKLEYSEHVASKVFLLDLVWGSHSEYVVDNPSSLTIEVFKCHYKASNCGHCLLLDKVYGCVWCTDSCTHPSDCTNPAFLERDAMCPNPKIISFSPRGGPVKGQTALTISGINLGKAASDLNISVGDKPCSVLNDSYKPTERVMCKTGKADVSFNDTIRLSVRGVLNSTKSEGVYIYKDPTVTTFSPRKGPMSGGTRVTVTGTDLDFGSTLEVLVVGTSEKPATEKPATEKPATLLWRNGTHLVFVMTRCDPPGSTVLLKILVDQSPILFSTMNSYTYSEDPKITSMSPKHSLLSGGNMLEFRGTNLVISQPQFILYVRNENRNESYTTNCTSPSPSFMHCPTPDLRHLNFSREEKLEFDYGFIMDDVESVLKIQEENPSIGQLHYVRDPNIFKFKSPVPYSLNEPLKIYGENLNIFEVFNDFNIYVSDPKCSSPKFTPTMIQCSPPKEPKNLNSDGDALVVVVLGNLVFEVGYLSYHDYGLSTIHIIAIACGIAVPLLIGLILLIVCLRRSHQHRSRSLPFGRIIDGSRKDRSNNSYSRTEMEPLRDHRNEGETEPYEDLRQDDGRFIQNLLRKIENPRRRNAAREILVSRDRLDMGNIIGRGHFSCVYLATLKDTSMRNPVQVAAKTIEGPVFDEKVFETILRESVVMSNFNHARLVSLVGLCLNSRTNPIVILPFMSNGNLRTYIKDKSKNFTARQLLLMSQQVAEGMSYLSSCDLVHRNLAARNCLLDENLEVKVSDFVLCHELFEHGLQYGSPDDWGKLPIKWMAPETLEGFVFTTYSDVWSFGVLVWELMTRGITPYSDIPLTEMRVFLNTGQRLKKPKYCPETVYRIMADCWQKVAERRPTFPDLVNRLEVLLNPPRKRQPTNSAADEEPLYVNTTEPSSSSYLRPSIASPDA